MAERLTLPEMRATAAHMNRLPYTDADIAAITRATPAVASKLSPKYDPSEGMLYLVSNQLHMEFVVVKSLRKRTLFGARRPNYTVMMGFEHGEVWEQGPTVATARAVAYMFTRMVQADQWMDEEYGRKK
ncbi:hypothetical protein MKI84_01340 [Ancylobacter sp. A5.8]|uniref:hypothetical protein n=1 Tax=Ancylobacter gelatini TaxID=2919920 RepID=UPI001F4E7DE4|nr:hypothetical protein [Ancylobacter gelatini]MCJ8141556.1 hypothetical protein [Ancylobacter gelatini]